MKTWLDKLCEPLEHPQYPQIKGVLSKTIKTILGYEQVIGKCAEGEIACQNNIKYQRNQAILRYDDLNLLGIPKDLIENFILPYFNYYNGIQGYIDYIHYNIGQWIVGLNDSGFTYPQIVEFLRVTFEDAV